MASPLPSTTNASGLSQAGLVALPSSSQPRLERQRQHLSIAARDLRPAGLGLERQPCTCCGGSGMLRITVQSHRTCMDCLGGGQRLLTSADLLGRSGLRTVVSSSAAG